MNSCEHCSRNNHGELCIDKIPIFNNLTPEEKEKVMDASTHKRYDKGEIIFTSGDYFDNLFIVNKGIVKISKISAMGKEQILQILEPGGFMGELSLFSKTILNSTAEALEQTEICLIRGTKIRDLILEKPEISLKFLQKYTERVEEAENLIEQIGLRDVEQRIANFLLLEIKKKETSNNKVKEYEITLPVSKRDLALLIGTTQETLSRKLSIFQDNGLIKLKGQRRIIVTDRDSLEEMR